MITRHPLGRQDLRIKRRDKVLEIGPGHDPMFRSDVIVDKFPHDDTHRCGKVLIFPHQQFVEADGEQLPFSENAFDYVICNQVLEHADNPARFIEEMVRVGKRGYVETPSMLGELMFPKESHRWVILLIEDKLVFYEKEKMPVTTATTTARSFSTTCPTSRCRSRCSTYPNPTCCSTASNGRGRSNIS